MLEEPNWIRPEDHVSHAGREGKVLPHRIWQSRYTASGHGGAIQPYWEDHWWTQDIVQSPLKSQLDKWPSHFMQIECRLPLFSFTTILWQVKREGKQLVKSYPMCFMTVWHFDSLLVSGTFLQLDNRREIFGLVVSTLLRELGSSPKTLWLCSNTILSSLCNTPLHHTVVLAAKNTQERKDRNWAT